MGAAIGVGAVQEVAEPAAALLANGIATEQAAQLLTRTRPVTGWGTSRLVRKCLTGLPKASLFGRVLCTLLAPLLASNTGIVVILSKKSFGRVAPNIATFVNQSRQCQVDLVELLSQSQSRLSLVPAAGQNLGTVAVVQTRQLQLSHSLLTAARDKTLLQSQTVSPSLLPTSTVETATRLAVTFCQFCFPGSAAGRLPQM